MSFRNEVRKFMRGMELALGKKEIVVQEQGRMILVLQAQNTDLLNRLMARDYPELQSWVGPRYKKEGDVDLDFESDESLAGTDVNPDNVEDAE